MVLLPLTILDPVILKKNCLYMSVSFLGRFHVNFSPGALLEITLNRVPYALPRGRRIPLLEIRDVIDTFDAQLAPSSGVLAVDSQKCKVHTRTQDF